MPSRFKAEGNRMAQYHFFSNDLISVVRFMERKIKLSENICTKCTYLQSKKSTFLWDSKAMYTRTTTMHLFHYDAFKKPMVIISHVVFVILPAQNAWNQRTLKVKLLLNPSGGGEAFFHNCIHNLKKKFVGSIPEEQGLRTLDGVSN